MTLRILMCCFLAISGIAQEKIQNMKHFTDSIPGQKLIYISASWCQICAKQKKVLQQLDDSVEIFEMTSDFHEPVHFKEREYTYRMTGIDQGFHEFIDILLKDKVNITYPTLVLIDEFNTIRRVLEGYQTADSIRTALETAQGFPDSNNSGSNKESQ